VNPEGSGVYSSVALNYSRTESGLLSIEGCALLPLESAVYYQFPLEDAFIHDDLALNHFQFGITLDEASFLPTGGSQVVSYFLGQRSVYQ